MKRFSKSPFHDVEARLREQRPEPRQEFLAALVDSVTPRRSRGRISARRTLLAAGFSAVVLASLAALGGVSYAASAVDQTARPFTAVARLVGINSSTHASHAVKVAKTLSKAVSSKSTSSRTVRGLTGNKGGDDEHGNNNNGHHGDEDDDQYKPGKGCGDKNHVHSEHNKCKGDGGGGHGDDGGHGKGGNH